MTNPEIFYEQTLVNDNSKNTAWLECNIRAEKEAAEWEVFNLSNAEQFSDIPPENYIKLRYGRQKKICIRENISCSTRENRIRYIFPKAMLKVSKMPKGKK